MTANPVHHRWTKHIEIDVHFIHEKVALGEVRVLHVPSSHQFVDIMTKGLHVQLFIDFRSSLCVREPPATTGGVLDVYISRGLIVIVLSSLRLYIRKSPSLME
jgi:hypothetical protein